MDCSQTFRPCPQATICRTYLIPFCILVQWAYFYAIFTLQKHCNANFKSFIFNCCTLPPVTWILKQHHHSALVMSKGQSPAVKAAVTGRRSGRRPLSKLCPRTPAVAAAVAHRTSCCSPAVACLRNCRPPPSQLPSPIVACCCLPPPPIVVSSTARSHFIAPSPHGIITTDIVTISSSPPACSCFSSRCPPPALAATPRCYFHRGCWRHLHCHSSCAASEGTSAACGLRLSRPTNRQQNPCCQ